MSTLEDTNNGSPRGLYGTKFCYRKESRSNQGVQFHFHYRREADSLEVLEVGAFKTHQGIL